MTTFEIIKPVASLSFAATLGRVTAFGRAVEQAWEDHLVDGQHIVLNLAAAPYEIPQIVTF